MSRGEIASPDLFSALLEDFRSPAVFFELTCSDPLQNRFTQLQGLGMCRSNCEQLVDFFLRSPYISILKSLPRLRQHYPQGFLLVLFALLLFDRLPADFKQPQAEWIPGNGFKKLLESLLAIRKLALLELTVGISQQSQQRERGIELMIVRIEFFPQRCMALQQDSKIGIPVRWNLSRQFKFLLRTGIFANLLRIQKFDDVKLLKSLSATLDFNFNVIDHGADFFTHGRQFGRN